MRKLPVHRCRRSPPFFRPVPLRARADDWSEERQCALLAGLYWTGSVTTAARGVEITRASAYPVRERKGAGRFAAAWDRVLSTPGSGRWKQPTEDFWKVTDRELQNRLERGLVQPVSYQGRVCVIRRKPDDSALLRLLRRKGGFTDPYW